jgi:hypothetical protein
MVPKGTSMLKTARFSLVLVLVLGAGEAQTRMTFAIPWEHRYHGMAVFRTELHHIA